MPARQPPAYAREQGALEFSKSDKAELLNLDKGQPIMTDYTTCPLLAWAGLTSAAVSKALCIWLGIATTSLSQSDIPSYGIASAHTLHDTHMIRFGPATHA